MKTAISVPDELYEKAEKYAKAHSLSRSELYQDALERYLTENTDQDITRRLNEVYASEDSGLPAGITKMQAKTIRKHNESW